MKETFERNGKQTTLIDLSDRLGNDSTPYEVNAHQIQYSDHRQGVHLTEKFLGLGAEYFPKGMAWATEELTISTHSSTHIDAPYHYGPETNGMPARTIDQVPLQWCYGDGILLDMRHKQIGDGISEIDIQQELERIDYVLKPFDIVLVHTGASQYFGTPNYFTKQPGLLRSATEWLVDRGIRLIGIDAWGLDRPFDRMAEDAKKGKGQFWEAHLLGREKEYCQIEKLCNLEQIPKPFGFTVSAFPINIKDASAGWSRVVAIMEE
ncbi:cyclase family protein [Salinithrix halophila]|uniref:Cyclase family protein n=1 Tax=Salinithrix halophila TaxID=1485204 RepID=A0ABV8JIA0_9BACL